MKLDKERVQDAATTAIDMVEDIEEPYKSQIYPVIFKILLLEEYPEDKHIQKFMAIPKPISEDKEQAPREGIYSILSTSFNWSKYSYVHDMNSYDQYLLVLKIALEEFEIDGLTPPEIQKILTEKFRIARTYNAVSMALASLRGKEVNRIPKGNGYVYRISKIGLDRVEEVIGKLKNVKPL